MLALVWVSRFKRFPPIVKMRVPLSKIRVVYTSIRVVYSGVVQSTLRLYEILNRAPTPCIRPMAKYEYKHFVMVLELFCS